MVYFVRLAINDLKNIIRDRFLVYATIILPVALIIVSRLIFPWLAEQFPIMKAYYFTFFLMFLIMIPMVFGFITAFLIMDERDEDLLTVLRVMPISRNSYLLYRMFFMSVFAFVYLLIFPFLSGLPEGFLYSKFSYIPYIPIAVLLSLFTPMIALFGNVFAKNKIQTFAIFKISGTIFFIPIFGIFMTDNLRYLFGLIPNFWSFECINILKNTGEIDILPLGIGFAFHIAILAALFYVFNKKF